MKSDNKWPQYALKAVSLGLEQLNQLKGGKPNFVHKETIRDLVTPYDRAIESLIDEALLETGLPRIGEESFDFHAFKEISQQRHWQIDPIDGTVNFCKGIPFFGVSVGLVSLPHFELGAMGFPKLGELYFSDGTQAFLNGKRLKVEATPLCESLVTVCLGSQLSPELRSEAGKLFHILNVESQGALRIGSAAASLGYLASGKFQAVVGLRCKIWDVAAGLAIAQSAGVKIETQFHDDSTTVSFIAACPIAFENIHRILEGPVLNDMGASHVDH